MQKFPLQNIIFFYLFALSSFSRIYTSEILHIVHVYWALCAKGRGIFGLYWNEKRIRFTCQFHIQFQRFNSTEMWTLYYVYGLYVQDYYTQVRSRPRHQLVLHLCAYHAIYQSVRNFSINFSSLFSSLDAFVKLTEN